MNFSKIYEIKNYLAKIIWIYHLYFKCSFIRNIS
nr:MAG TPA: hypothetical protein [Caudoviricetes sp.]